MTAHRWTATDRPDVLECADCGAICTWDLTDRSTHPDAGRDREATAERRIEWTGTPIARRMFVAGVVFAGAKQCRGHATWFVGKSHGQSIRDGIAPTLTAAQLAAEDALRSIAAEILRAVGK